MGQILLHNNHTAEVRQPAALSTQQRASITGRTSTSRNIALLAYLRTGPSQEDASKAVPIPLPILRGPEPYHVSQSELCPFMTMHWCPRSLPIIALLGLSLADALRIDDSDPAVYYHGPWTHGLEIPDDMSQNWDSTLHYSNIPNTTATLEFTGEPLCATTRGRCHSCPSTARHLYCGLRILPPSRKIQHAVAV